VTVRTVLSDSLDPGYFVPDERIDRLTALGDALLEPQTLAGADGWADPAWTQYMPRKTVAHLFVHEGVAPFSSPDVGPSGWPFGDDPRTFGQPFASTEPWWPVARCAVLDATAANEAVAALPAGAVEPSDATVFWRGGTMAWAERGLELRISLWALLSDQDREEQPCGDLWQTW
jgi:hypothetical protein